MAAGTCFSGRKCSNSRPARVQRALGGNNQGKDSMDEYVEVKIESVRVTQGVTE